MGNPTTTLTSTSAISAAEVFVRSDLNYIVVPYDPERWEGALHGLLGIECRVLIPTIKEAKKATKYSYHWVKAVGELLDCTDPEEARTRVLAISDKRFYNRQLHKPIARLAYVEADRFDPGRLFMKSIERASAILTMNLRDRDHSMDEFAGALSRQLLEFYDRHANINDDRYVPLRSMGQCMGRLAEIIRAAA